MRQIARGIRTAEQHGQLQFSVVLDRYDTGRANSDTTMVRSLMAILSDHYPERLGTAYVLYPNWLFSIAYRIAKAFLPKRTMDKVLLFSGDTMFDELHQYIAPDQLQPAYGGTSSYEYTFSNEAAEDAVRFGSASGAAGESAAYLADYGWSDTASAVFYTATEASCDSIPSDFDDELELNAGPNGRSAGASLEVAARVAELEAEAAAYESKLDVVTARIKRLDARIRNTQATLAQAPAKKSCCAIQ